MSRIDAAWSHAIYKIEDTVCRLIASILALSSGGSFVGEMATPASHGTMKVFWESLVESRDREVENQVT